MKNANAIFTKTRLGLDNRVWLTLLFVFFISLFLLSFKIATQITCVDFTIKPIAVTADKPNSFYTGETIVFTDSGLKNDDLVWNFDDGTAPVSGDRVKHSFGHDGRYTVTGTANGKCIQSVTIEIKEFVSRTPAVIASSSSENIITGTDTPHIGEKVLYSATKKADRYEWSVLNAPEYPTLTDSVANYTFQISGSRIIVLKLNGDDKKVYKKNIVVIQPLPHKTGSPTTTRIIPPIPIFLPPKVNSFTPASGTTGTTVTIIGSNFNNVAAVSFGGTPALFAPLSPTTISATVGAGTTGPVMVTTKNGVGKSITIFIYTPPAAVNNSNTTQSAASNTKIIMIAPEEFQHLFQQVCDGKSDASAFNAYLCSVDGTKILANNEWTTVGVFCKKLKDKKKVLLGRKEYKINNVKVVRDAGNNNCVTRLIVDYK